MPATKKDRRKAAREVKTWLGFYLCPLVIAAVAAVKGAVGE